MLFQCGAQVSKVSPHFQRHALNPIKAGFDYLESPVPFLIQGVDALQDRRYARLSVEAFGGIFVAHSGNRS